MFTVSDLVLSMWTPSAIDKKMLQVFKTVSKIGICSYIKLNLQSKFNYLSIMSEEKAKFTKYHSIENAYRKEFVQKVREHPCSQGKWCVMEKIHGSNFSFTINESGVLVGKRTSFVDDCKKFFNCHEVANKIEPKIQNLFNSYRQNGGKYRTLVVYGELFGGFYTGYPKTHQMIQKGVQYCPQQEFIAFDIMGRDHEDGDDDSFLNYHRAIELFQSADVLFADIIYSGSFEDCLKWSVQHNTDPTMIPSLFGLENIDGNVREGHVLKPIQPAQFQTGESIVLKDKNDKFKQNQRSSHNLRKEEVSKENKGIITGLLEYVNENRFDGIVSKHGQLTRKLIGKYINLLAEDATTDYQKDGHVIPQDQLIKVRKAIKNDCRKIVLANL